VAVSGLVQHWQIAPGARHRLSREFDDGMVCFDPDSGETLLISHLAHFLLDVGARHPGESLPLDLLLAEVLAADASNVSPAEGRVQVIRALAELQQAGFATCAAAS
jgi:hypothetical protein